MRAFREFVIVIASVISSLYPELGILFPFLLLRKFNVLQFILCVGGEPRLVMLPTMH